MKFVDEEIFKITSEALSFINQSQYHLLLLVEASSARDHNIMLLLSPKYGI